MLWKRPWSDVIGQVGQNHVGKYTHTRARSLVSSISLSAVGSPWPTLAPQTRVDVSAATLQQREILSTRGRADCEN